MGELFRRLVLKRQVHAERLSEEFEESLLGWVHSGFAVHGALSLVVERRHGILIRPRAAPIGRSRILAWEAIACSLTTLAVTCVLLAVAVIIFGVGPDSLPLPALAILPASVGFVGVVMVISVPGKTESAVSGPGRPA